MRRLPHPQTGTGGIRLKPTVLLLVLFSELALGGLLWKHAQEPVRFGFLIKNGNEYVVAWKRGQEFIKTQSYGSLRKAVEFARKDLNLSAANNPLSKHEIESVWFEDHFSSYQVMFTTGDMTILHHLTFKRLGDAVFFAKAFRNGDYSPSPLGHSVYLRPIRSN